MTRLRLLTAHKGPFSAFILAVLVSASMAAPSLPLIPAGSSWKYFDRGTPPENWSEPGFNDTTWPTGFAELGYGEGDENTRISPGPDPDNPYASAYFRKRFTVTDVSGYNRLQLGVLRDDGAIVYLNGEEIYRSNMPTGEVTSTTYALTNVSGGAERFYFTTNLDPAILLSGQNVLAVEVHQSGPASDDLSFNLRLTLTNTEPDIVRGPYLQSGAPTSVVICWRTSNPTDSRVRWGMDTNVWTDEVISTNLTTEHQIPITGLQPDTKYYYSVGNISATIQTNSPYFYFVTVPTETRPFRIWAIGDAGTANSAQRAVRNAYRQYETNRATDLWLMLGDNAYPAGSDSEYQRAVFEMYTNMLQNTLLYTTIGNHETYTDPDDLAYLRIFSLPMNAEAGGIASGTERYYSFDYANVHFICLDSMTNDRTTNGAMYAWLEQDLLTTTKEWIVSFWHHPPYTKGSHDSDDDVIDFELGEMRENILPLLEAYGADLILCGHSHCYERSFFLHGHYGKSDTLTPEMITDSGSGREDEGGPYRKVGLEGAVYVVAGSAGQISGGPLNHPAMFTSLNELGSLVIDVDHKKLHARFLRENGTIDDYFTLSKESFPLTITSVSVTNVLGNDVITIRWNSMPGVTYEIWRADTLDADPANWMLLAPPVVATGTASSWSEVIVLERPTSFYRVSTVGP